MPSGDSSPCTISARLQPGFILVQGNESPDAVNGVLLFIQTSIEPILV